MILRSVLTTAALVVLACPLAFASDADSAIAPTVDFGAKINEAVTDLVTGALPPVMPFGWTLLALFGAYALLKAILDAQLKAVTYHHYVPGAVILPSVAVIFRILIAAGILTAYKPFHQIFPNLANTLTKTVSMAELKDVFAFLNDISNKLPAVGMLQVLPGIIAVVVLVVAALSSFGLTLMTSMSHMVVGVLVIVGPLIVPFYVLPRFDGKFWSWIDNLLVYSMYRFVAACFAMLWAHVYIALFASIKVFSVGSWVVAIGSFIIITLGSVFTAFRIPEVTHIIFGGTGGLAADISRTAQSAVLRGVNKFLK